MDDLDNPSILAIGAKLANLARAKATGELSANGQPASLAEVDSAREAFSLLRVVQFDLVAIGPNVTDMTASQLANRLRQAKPWQKWVRVADDLVTDTEEMEARSLGAIAVLEGPDAWKDVLATARRVRRRHPETRVPGLALNPLTA